MANFTVLHFHAASRDSEVLPTLKELLCFPSSGGKVINMAEEIGAKYGTFGVLLLDDDNGVLIDAMEKELRGNAEAINRRILQQWLSGKGRQPMNWGTLEAVLCDVGLNALAHKIHEVKLS